MSEVKRLPDSAGFWIREGGENPVRIYRLAGDSCEESGLGLSNVAPGRWLKVELPTFPPREKATVRLCWATYSGKRQLFSWLDGGRYPFWRCDHGVSAARDDELTDIVWITSEWLDEITPAKD